MPITVPQEQLEAFCRKWQVRELSLFGSALGDDFGPASDVDVLIELDDAAPWTLLDWVTMKDDLKGILGRDVDLTSKKGLRNPFLRKNVLSTRRVIYAAYR